VTELERLRNYARECSMMMMRLSGGGSEMFMRIGDEFYAEPSLCEQRIREKQEMLRRLDERRNLTAASGHHGPASRASAAEASARQEASHE
jgi:hypothetical protein